MIQLRAVLLPCIVLCAACGPEASFEVEETRFGLGTYSEVTGFGSNPGALRGYKYVPENMPADAPLVLALHACSQTAADFRRAGWEALADQWKFYVLYPEQQTANNAARCFNWAGEYGVPTNLTRGEGENQSIKQMIDQLMADHSIDPSRVFAMGHSGGGAQAALLMATWPDVFAGGAMIAGIPYNCTTTFTQVTTCLSPGINRTAMEWGDRARAGYSAYRGPYPKISIWHGTADTTVHPSNLTELLEQWTNVHGIDLTADVTSTVDGATRKEYRGAGQETLVETYEIPGMNHGTPVDPSEGCGTAGPFFLDAGICAVRRIGEFFGLSGAPLPGDTTPPVVSLSAPVDGATVQGLVSLQATATDDTGVVRVEFFANGTRLGADDTAPYTHDWNTSTLPAGNYALRVVATDAAGNSGEDAGTTVRVDSQVRDTTAPVVNVTSPAGGATVSGMVEVQVEASDDVSLARVEISIDGTPVASLTMPPYAFTWNSAAAGEGPHAVSARAIDAAGNEATDDDTEVTVTLETPGDTTAPLVNITSPQPMATVEGLIEVTVTATDDTAVQVVLLFMGDTLIGSDYRAPYEFLWDTAVVPEGAHVLSARAFDTAGNLAVDDDTTVTVRHVASTEDPEEPEAGEPINAGNRYWGCSTSPRAPDLLLFALLALGARFTLSRRNRHG